MGMYIEIECDYPCAKCGAPLTGWQSKELRYHGYPVEPLLQTLALVPGMDGEIHNSHEGCDHFTEYAVINGILGDATDRRTTGNDPPPISHTIPTDAPLAHTLAEAKGKPVVVQVNGRRYRVVPENPWAFYTPPPRGVGVAEARGAPNTEDALPVPPAEEAVTSVSALKQVAGSWVGLGVFEKPLPEQGGSPHKAEGNDADDAGFRRVIREAKPPKKSIENSEETRYGRESYGNARYNAALDEYERALMAHLARDEAGEEE